jgi:hypothetical protein
MMASPDAIIAARRAADRYGVKVNPQELRAIVEAALMAQSFYREGKPLSVG